MNKEQFEYTAKFVRCSLDPWLQLHFGPRCDNYEFGCECCRRWRAADKLLGFENISQPADLEGEIAELKDALQWRQAMLDGFSKGLSEYEQRLIESCDKHNDIGPLDDGFYRFWVKDRGAVSAADLRIVAAELDRRNAFLEQQLEADMGMRAEQEKTHAEVALAAPVVSTPAGDVGRQEV
jgi:hypothetical protein